MPAVDLNDSKEPNCVVGLRRLHKCVPLAWINDAVRATGTASIRRRRLPAGQVVWLVVALALYRHQSASEIVDELDIALPALDGAFVNKSAITQARQRIGPAPLEWLFKESARNWITESDDQATVKGLTLFAIDGTTLRAADSQCNRPFWLSSEQEQQDRQLPAGSSRDPLFDSNAYYLRR
jgi:hypothetical protein